VNASKKKSVTVRIAGEEHSLRSHAEPDYTKRCARYVDRRIHEIKQQVGLLEGHKAAILAALSITDEFFRSQEELARYKAESSERVRGLSQRIESALAQDSQP
jgi:cell division protein ZapA